MRGLVTLDASGNMHDQSRVTVDGETVMLAPRCLRGSRAQMDRLADTLAALGYLLHVDTFERNAGCLTFEVERLTYNSFQEELNTKRLEVAVIAEEEPVEILLGIRIKCGGVSTHPEEDAAEAAETLIEMITRLGPIRPEGVRRANAWYVTGEPRRFSSGEG